MIALAFKIAANTGSDWSKFVAEQSHSPYSHCELWTGGPQNAAICWSSREFAGVSGASIDLTTSEWTIVPLQGSPAQEDFIHGFCAGANGKAYDTLGLLGYRTGSGLHDDHDVFCSEFCASALQAASAIVLPRAPWLMSPGDLYEAAIKGQ